MGRLAGEVQTELRSLHAAALREAKAKGKEGYLIPIKAWEKYLANALSEAGTVITPQTCKDRTWWLEAVGLIEWRRREGIILLEPVEDLVAA